MFNPFTQLSEKNRFGLILSVIFLLSILVTLPVWLDGIPSSRDIPQQYQFAQTFYETIKNGDFYPSWSGASNYGYGDIGIRFYPPLTYYILSFLRLVSGNWFDASLLFFILGYFVSGIGVYLWSREWFSQNASLAAAVTYLILPYHIMQIYVGALFAEFTAAAILPFCFLFTTRVCQKGRALDIWGLAVTFGLLALTHLPTIVMGCLALFIYALFSLPRKNLGQSIFKLSLAVGGGLLLSSFYWVRMVTELNFVNHNSEIYSTGFYSYKTQFVFSYLFPFAEVAISAPTALMNMIAMLTLGILIPFAAFYFFGSKAKIASLKNVLAMTVFTFFMATPVSLMIWELIPLLQKIQFPFRWLTIFSLGSVIFVAAGFNQFIEYFNSPRRYLSFLAMGLILLSIPYNISRLMNPFITYPKDFFNRVVPGFQSQPSYECWWAIWTQTAPAEKAKSSNPRPDFIADKVVINQRAFEIKSWSATERVFLLEAGQAGQASLATMFYPHWKASVNGQEVEVSPSEIGLISFPVTAEAAEVRVYFEEPRWVKTSFYLSALTWLTLLNFPFFYWLLRRKNSDDKI